MEPEVILFLLEEKLKDIKNNLSDSWQGFVKGLKESSENITPDKKALDEWTKKIIELFKGYPYTRGLLEGFNRGIFFERRIPSASMIIKDEETPDIPSGKIYASKEYEKEIVKRIKDIVKKAEELK